MALVSLYCEEAMRKDEQFKVKGCRIARPRGRDVKRRSASMRLRVFFSGTPALINMERSGMLIKVWAMPRSFAERIAMLVASSSITLIFNIKNRLFNNCHFIGCYNFTI